MAKDSDQRSYSVDEMMDKLRKGERDKRRTDEAELVTRADGSKAMRVRKRRRRTDQPVKTKEIRQKRYGLIAMISGVALIIIAAVTVLLVLAKFNSKGYREDFEASLSGATGAEVGVSDLSVSPLNVQATSFQLAWSPGGLPKTLKLSELKGDLRISSFLGSQLKGREVFAKTGTMVAGPPDGSITPTVFDGSLPLHYAGYRCSQFDLVYGADPASPVIKLRGSELTARPREEGGLRFTLSGGFLRLGSWTELKVDNALAEWNDGVFNLVSVYTRSGDAGEAVFKGVKPISTSSPTVFDVSLKQYPISELLGVDTLGRLFDCAIDVPSGSLTFDPRFDDSAQVVLPFTGSNASIEGFRFLGGLSSILRGKDYYARPEGGKIEGVFKWDRDQLRVEGFKFEAKPHLIIEGDFQVTGTALGGSLKIGVPEALMMKTQTEPRYSSFTLPYLGYCWTDVKLSGTEDLPVDNFQSKLEPTPTKPLFPPPPSE